MAKKLAIIREAAAESQLEADARELHESLDHLRRVYHFRDRQRICCYDLSVTQYYAIDVLVDLGEITLKKLSQELHLDKSTTSRLVDSLEVKGYVRRTIDPRDKRALRIMVTRKGINIYGKIELGSVAEVRKMLESIDPDVRHAAVRLFARLEKAASQRWGIERSECIGGEQRE